MIFIDNKCLLDVKHRRTCTYRHICTQHTYKLYNNIKQKNIAIEKIIL